MRYVVLFFFCFFHHCEAPALPLSDFLARLLPVTRWSTAAKRLFMSELLADIIVAVGLLVEVAPFSENWTHLCHLDLGVLKSGNKSRRITGGFKRALMLAARRSRGKGCQTPIADPLWYAIDQAGEKEQQFGSFKWLPL